MSKTGLIANLIATANPGLVSTRATSAPIQAQPTRITAQASDDAAIVSLSSRQLVSPNEVVANERDSIQSDLRNSRPGLLGKAV